MQKPHKEPHPIELLLLVAWLVAEGLLLLRLVVAPMVAAALALLPAPHRRPAAPATAPSPAREPDVHPLATMAEALVAELEVHPVVELRRRARQAGIRKLARSGRRTELLATLAGMAVTMA